MCQFCKSLKLNTNLQIINFYSNSTNYGFGYFIDTLSVNKTLKIINIQDANFEKCAKFLCDYLSNIPSLYPFFNSSDKDMKEKIGKSWLLESLHNKFPLNRTLYKIRFNEEDLQFLLSCNFEWTPHLHSTMFECFKSSVLSLYICTHVIERKYKFKLPKFLFYEIIKMIDRKSYLQLWKSTKKEAVEEKKESFGSYYDDY